VKEGGNNLLPIYLSALTSLCVPGQSSQISFQKVRKTYLRIVETTTPSPVQNLLAIISIEQTCIVMVQKNVPAAKSSRTPENLPLFP